MDREPVFVNMTYEKKGGAMYEMVERITHGLPYKSIHLDAISGAQKRGFIDQVLSSLRTRKSISIASKQEQLLTISIDGRYLFSDMIMVLHLPDRTNNWIERLLVNRALKHAKYHVAISETTANEFKEKFGNREIYVVKLGIDPHAKVPRKEHDGIVVSHVGGISDGNSRRLPMLEIPKILREAFPGKEITFRHIGGKQNSNEQALYEACLSNEIIPNFSSNVQAEEVWKTYAESDLYIYMSTKEGYSLSPMEALMMETPCLISDIPVHREIYGDAEGVNFASNWGVSAEDIRKAYELGSSSKYRQFAMKRTWSDTIREFDSIIKKVT